MGARALPGDISKQHWLVTGAAGFIGSHLVGALLRAGARVTAIDNFATGRQGNVAWFSSLKEANQQTLRFLEGDVRDLQFCRTALRDITVVSHQAALGSVPRSVANPQCSLSANVMGFTTLLQAARDSGVRRIVYASSSSVYGDSDAPEKHEGLALNPRSPYAVAKLSMEYLAAAAAPLYGFSLVGLRYFNVFGPRQDPNGAYAAVIPRWLHAMRRGEVCTIFGDGKTSRDFCYVDNVIQANLRAGTAVIPEGASWTANIAVGDELSLFELHGLLAEHVQRRFSCAVSPPQFAPFRSGDVRRSRASVAKARELLGYEPEVDVRTGVAKLVNEEFP